MKFLTLLEIELKKIMPFLGVLFGGGLLLMGGLFYKAINGYKADFIQKAAGQSVEDYVAQHGVATLAGIVDSQSTIFFAFISIALIAILSGFYLWYKEWFGQSKRIYMLLTLKGSRFTIFLSKLCAIIFAIIMYYGFVLLSLVLGGFLMNLILPAGLVGEQLVQGVVTQSVFMPYALPNTLGAFGYSFMFVVMMFSILSTFVMLDRSKRIYGMILGVIYSGVTIALFLYTKSLFLFQDEVFYVNWAFVLGATAVSAVLSAYLLKKKVTI